MNESLEDAPRKKSVIHLKLASKLVSAAAICTYFGFWFYHDYRNWGALGKEAFMAHELRRWERYYMPDRPIQIFYGAMYIAFILCIYEFVAFVIFRFITWNWRKEAEQDAAANP